MTTKPTVSSGSILNIGKPHLSTRRLRGLAADRYSRFKGDISGGPMIMFGLTLFPLFFFVGVSADFGRMLAIKSQALAMADAAALAGGRSFQTGATYTAVTPPAGSPVNCIAGSGSANENAQRAACNYLLATLSKNVVQTIVEFPATTSTTEFKVQTTSWVRTPFLGAGQLIQAKAADPNAPAGCASNGWACQKVVSASTSLVASGTTVDGTSIEIAMMIDITGSMAESDGAGSTKIQTVKKAAADAVNILIWADQSKYTSKVSLVPFAADVRLPTATAFSAATGSAWGQKCVTERTGNQAYTDATPDTGSFITKHATCNVPSSAALVPLTSDKLELTNQINGLSTAGTTAGHIGTAWAWYTLSPNFSSLWATANRPQAYGTAKLKKYAILMTDGDYNTQYSSNGSSQDQARELCKGMKQSGIEIYTIGAQVSASAKAFLTDCAGTNPNVGDSTHYYDATDGVKLEAAFRDIALKISTLRVSM
jgi:Flp pilus assembly protein TadG